MSRYPFRGHVPLTEEDVLASACPDCGKAAGERCVYLPQTNVDPAFVHYRSAKTQARFALTGTPTKRPHHGRLTAAHDRAYRRALKQWRKDREVPVEPATAARRAAAVAEREFDRREYEQLRAWLAKHARLFDLPSTDRSSDNHPNG